MLYRPRRLLPLVTALALAACTSNIGPSDPQNFRPSVLGALTDSGPPPPIIQPASVHDISNVPSVGGQILRVVLFGVAGVYRPPLYIGAVALSEERLDILIWHAETEQYRRSVQLPLSALVKVELTGPRSSWVEIETAVPANSRIGEPDTHSRWRVFAREINGDDDRPGARALCEELRRRLSELNDASRRANVVCS